MRLVGMHQTPLIFIFDDAVDSASCDDIIAAAQQRKPTEVTLFHQDKETGRRTESTKRTYESGAGQSPQERAVAELVAQLLQCDSSPDMETEPTVHFTQSSGAPGMTLGLHVDTNQKKRRFATGLLYLNNVNGGATVFPACEVAADHPAAVSGRCLLDAGCTHSATAAAIGGGDLNEHDIMLRSIANDLVAGKVDGGGVAVVPRQGRLLLFFTRGDDGDVDACSWHGGADVTGPEGKWTMQCFKEIPLGVTSDGVAQFVLERRCALQERFGSEAPAVSVAQRK